MKKKMKLCLIIITLVLCFCNTNNVQAKTLAQLKSELATMKDKYNKNQSQKQMTEAEIKKVKQEIESIGNEIDKINQDIIDLNNDIEKRNKEIKKMSEEIKSIMHYYQLNSGESFYLEYVFNATDYTDFIYRLALTEQLSEYRKKTINKYNQLIEENKKKIAEISAKKTELNKLESELATKYKKLETELTGITTAGVSIKDEISDMESTIKLYQNTYKCSDNEELTTCVNRYNNKNNSGSSSTDYNVPSAYGFYVPITYWTRIYEFQHHDNGLDLSTPEGQSVHPIADGQVIDIWYKYSCGGNMVWIAHNVNGKKYTSGYFHLKTVNVAIGQQVSHSSVIGTSGGARKGTSTNTYDGCTTGPHLHLQVSTGHYSRYLQVRGQTGLHISWSAWNSKSFNPRNIINF